MITSLYFPRYIALVFVLAVSLFENANAQCTFSPTGIATNVSCFGANDGAVNLTISSTGGSGGTGSYCFSTYGQPCGNCPTTWDHINNFSTTGGSTNISNLSSGCNGTLPNNYTYFPQTVTVNPGGSFGFEVQSANSGTGCSNQFNQGFHIWVDWNDDADFNDAGEDIWSNPPSFALLTGTISVPANVSCGIRRMRVLCAYAQTPSDPCGNYGYGEVEDYNVQVGPPITYTWSNGATTEDISGLAPGPYSVTVTDGTQSSTLNFNVAQPSQVLTNVTAVGNDTLICPGEFVTLNASGVPTWNYTWSNGSTGSSISVNQVGVYSVTVTNSNGCSATDLINVLSSTSTNPPIITPSDTTLLCQGASIDLTVVPANGVTWQPGGQTSGTVTVSQSGDYYVTYTDASGCTGQSLTSTIIVIPPPVTTITPSGPVTFCQGGSVTLSSNYPFGNLWSTGETTSSITVTSSGTYGLTVSVGGGCSDDATPIDVVVNPLPAAQINASGALSFCQGGNVTLTATPAGATYLWSNNIVTSQQTVASTSSFTVTVTDASGCTASAGPVNVTVNPIPAPPVIFVNGATTICAGSSVNLSSSYPSGNVWSSGQFTNSIDVTQSGTYSVTYTDATGCSAASSSTTITVNPIPTATFTLPTTNCVDDNVTITYTGNATAAAVYTWNFGGGSIVTGSGQGPYDISYSLLGVGSYTVSLEVTENGCTSNLVSQVTNIYTNPTGDFTISANAVCVGGTIDITYTGSAPLSSTFDWLFGNGTVVSGSGAGPYTVQFDTPGANGVSLVVTQGSCQSLPYDLPVTVNPPPVVAILSDYNAGCDSLAVQFTTNDYGGTYTWMFGNGAGSSQQNPTFVYQPGVYDVTLSVVDANGCEGTFTETDFISVYATPVAAFTSTPELVDTIEMDDANIHFHNMSLDAVSYVWDFSDGGTSTMTSPVYSYSESGLYQVQLIAINPIGCADTTQSEVFFVAPGAVTFIPTTFTPNNDGNNDVLRAYSNMARDVQFMVFDRIGQKLFESRDIEKGWDGTMRGQYCNTGVYIWYCKITYLNGRSEELFGDVSLLR